MNFGSKFVYLGNKEEDVEEVKVSEVDDVALSDSDVSDDDGETCLLDILDTAGQEEYSSLRDQYVRNGDGFVIIYSIIDKESYVEAEAIYRWMHRVRDEKCNVILVANKQDLKDEATVSSQEGRDLATKLGIPFFETSAKDGTGIIDAMKGLVRIIPRTDNDYKIVMLGSGAVGKSCITVRFVSDVFVDDYDPTIEDSYRKMIRVDGLNAVSKETRKAAKKEKKKKKKAVNPSTFYHSRQYSLPLQLNSIPLQQQQMLPSLQIMSTNQNQNSSTPSFTPILQQQQQQQQAMPSFFASAPLTNCVPPPPPPPPSSREPLEEPSTTVKKEQKADGNVVLISMRTLEEEPLLVTGDPIHCKKCDAVLTETAVLEADGDKKIWNCEFCGHANRDLDIEEDEIPKGDRLDYMLSPATQPQEEAAGDDCKKVETTSGVIIYCMDISSSMQALCEIPESQSSWRQERLGVTTSNNVSRLQCIQTAVERLADQLKSEQPEKQILLVVFSSQVFVKAGGSVEQLPSFNNVEKDSFEQLLEKGVGLCDSYPLKPLMESHEELTEAVRGLRTTGCTALGPALSICMGFASSIPSSEIVLCTDGEPNVGVGTIHGNTTDFYKKVGQYARSKNTTINILAVEGASCGLQSVSAAAEYSGGATNKLNPAEIVRQLRTIAQNEVVATSVTVRFLLHPEFVFNEPEFGDNLSQLEKEVGSARKETDLTFRFKLRDPTKKLELKSIPFQVQITYTRKDGMKCLRVLSKKNEATTSRQEMEQNICASVLSVSAMKTTAQLAKEGKGVEAQHMLKNVKRMVTRGAKTSEQKEARLALYNELETWDDHLTYKNDEFRPNQNQSDMSSNMIQQAQCMSSHRSDVGNSKMSKVLARKKMGGSSKASYYSYKNNLM